MYILDVPMMLHSLLTMDCILFVNTDDVCKCKLKSGGGVKTFGAVRGVLFYIYLILYSSYLCQSLSPFRYKEMHEWYLHSQKEEKNKIHCLPDDDDDMKKFESKSWQALHFILLCIFSLKFSKEFFNNLLKIVKKNKIYLYLNFYF